jgi:hypothetical protein
VTFGLLHFVATRILVTRARAVLAVLGIWTSAVLLSLPAGLHPAIHAFGSLTPSELAAGVLFFPVFIPFAIIVLAVGLGVPDPELPQSAEMAVAIAIMLTSILGYWGLCTWLSIQTVRGSSERACVSLAVLLGTTSPFWLLAAVIAHI